MTEDNSVDSHVFKEFARVKAKSYERGRNWLYQKNALAEYTHWAKMATWSYLDTALLINDIDPRGGLQRSNRGLPDYPQIKDYKAALDILKNAVDAGQMRRQDEPYKMLREVMRRGMPYPSGLSKAVIDHAEAILNFDERLAEMQADAARKNAEISEEASKTISEALDFAEVVQTDARAKDKEHRAEQQEGERKLENVYRVTGLLLKILKEKKFTQKRLIERMQTYYDPDAPENANKGLKETTVEEVFAESNKALKRLLESEDDF